MRGAGGYIGTRLMPPAARGASGPVPRGGYDGGSPTYQRMNTALRSIPRAVRVKSAGAALAVCPRQTLMGTMPEPELRQLLKLIDAALSIIRLSNLETLSVPEIRAHLSLLEARRHLLDYVQRVHPVYSPWMPPTDSHAAGPA